MNKPDDSATDGSNGGIGQAYRTLGYLVAGARRSSQELETLRPEIEDRLSRLAQQRDEAETRGDAAMLGEIGDESDELQRALLLLDHHKEMAM